MVVTFAMETIEEAVDRIAASGFEQVKFRDRNDWYRAYSKDEFERIRGPLWSQYVARFGEEDARACVDGARMRWTLAEQGQLRPGHIIARTPS
jgi:hypothetical protein